jgi:nucleoside-diphosphate-sugar epimerase
VSAQYTVVLVGGTGRTGRRVLEQLLNRGISVRAIVRSPQKIPAGIVKNPNLTVIEFNVLSLSEQDLQRHLRGCDAVISCLGHEISLKGVFGSPRDLVTQATTRLCRAIETLHPSHPVKFILMSSVSVNHPGGIDTRRGALEKAFMWMVRGVLPPARDNQRSADFLYDALGKDNPYVKWTAVRPDTLLEGDLSHYALHEGLVSSLFAPDNTTMTNVAHFMCALVTDARTWDEWNGKMPVIINT